VEFRSKWIKLGISSHWTMDSTRDGLTGFGFSTKGWLHRAR